MLIYLLAFYLFDDIEKYQNHSCESFCNVKSNFEKKMLVQPERLHFYLRFALGIIHGGRYEKNTQNNCFIQVKFPFSVVEISNAVTF